MMLEVEGETPEWFMKLMRHEAAHAYSYAYQLQKKKKWQQTIRVVRGSTATASDAAMESPRCEEFITI